MANIKDNLGNKANEIKEGITGKTNDLKQGIENKKQAISSDIAETKQKINSSIDSGKKAVSSFIKKLTLGLFLLAIVAGIGYYLFASMTYSDGSRTGQLIKISEKGYVFKTFEGELSLGGISVENDQTNIGSIWDFSVTDKAVFDKLQKLRGQKVVVQYEEKYRVIPWKGDTKYLISGVDPIQ